MKGDSKRSSAGTVTGRGLAICVALNTIITILAWIAFLYLWRQQSDWWRIDRSNLMTRIGVLEQRLEDLKEELDGSGHP